MEEKKILPPLVKGTESYKLTVTRDLEKKIRFLCDKLPRNEWSGTLFYTVEGSFKDKSLHIICKDFFLQDVGESTYTEFKNDVELAAYMANHELWDCYTGLMHSHDMMATFFSGTDISTLQSEGKDTNHFVSLIVNNAGKYTAAITRKIKEVSKGESVLEYNTFDNVTIEDASVPFERTSTYIEYYYLNVTIEEFILPPKSELELRLEEVRKSSNSFVNKKFYNTPSTPVSPINPLIPSKVESPVKPAYVQQSLFTPKEMGEITEDEEKDDEEFDGTIAYDIDHVNKELVHKTILQFVTGDIFSIYKQHIELNKWVENMPTLYKRRFGDIATSPSFESWVDSFIDFLAAEVYDEKLASKGSDYVTAIWAWDVIVALQEFKDNEYLDVFIDTLKHWLI